MPLRSSIELYGTWIFGRIFGVLFMTLQNASLGISVMGVVVITIDRYIATLHPLTHFTKKSRRMAIIINVLTWVLPFMLWFFLNAVWDFVALNLSDGLYGIPNPNFSTSLASSSIVLCLRFFGPLILIMTLYLRIYFHIRTRLRKRRPRSIQRSRPDNDMKNTSREGVKQFDVIRKESQLTSSKERERQVESYTSSHESPLKITIDNFDTNNKNFESEYRLAGTKRVDAISSISGANYQGPALKSKPTGKNRKAMRTLSFVVLAFAITWFPNGVTLMIYSISLSSSSVSTSDAFTEIARWITYSNSLLNPAAYALAQPLIRRTLTLLLCRICRQKLGD
ncbi:muscarinic acetylcholine receptor M2-like [Diadema setosum]|uniref:muscarinic acetylcholine receptor M2-like n=1 Tax=Diadema setosum TaxID=31175 RepID=UPI003B3ACF6B